MYAKDGILHIEKIVPESEQEVIDFLMPLQGYDCAIHFRMQTHGAIDLENCHPYELLPVDTGHPMWLMHNGILDTGNDADKTKSDTWHYVRDYLRPLLDPTEGGDPELIFKDAFQEILGNAIGGSNKFVIMDYTGRIATINEWAGVKHKGAWLSNTYAWSSTKAGFGYKGKHTNLTTTWDYNAADEEDDTFDRYKNFGKGSTDDDEGESEFEITPRISTVYEPDDFEYDQVFEDAMEREIIEFRSFLVGYEMDYADKYLGDDHLYSFMELNGFPALWEAMDALTDCMVTEEVFVDYIIDGSLHKMLRALA